MRKKLIYVSIGIIIFFLCASSGIGDAASDNLMSIIGENELYNPYFWNEKETLLEVDAEYYASEEKEITKINAKVIPIKDYQNGKVYKLIIEPIENAGDYLDEARMNIYLYVTSDKICRIWSYLAVNGELIEFYDNDVLLTKYLNTDKLIIQNSEIICQTEEMLSELENGKNSSISINGDQITYSRCDVKRNGEVGYYEWFTWEQKKGLVDYGSGYSAERDILYLTNITKVTKGNK